MNSAKQLEGDDGGGSVVLGFGVVGGFGWFECGASYYLWRDCYVTKTSLLSRSPLSLSGSLSLRQISESRQKREKKETNPALLLLSLLVYGSGCTLLLVLV